MSNEMGPGLKHIGGRYYHLKEHSTGRLLNLSKASLGSFVYGVLRCGGEVIQLWAFNCKFERSSVLAVVAMTPEMKTSFEASTRFILTEPPKITLNCGDRK